jgi:hypothetical protein
MSVRFQTSTLFKEISRRSFYKTSFRTKGVNKQSDSALCLISSVVSNTLCSISEANMPVITALAVAAHRNSVHTSERRVQSLERRLSSTSIGLYTPLGYEIDPTKLRRSYTISNPGVGKVGGKLRSFLDGNSSGTSFTQEIRRFYAKGKDKPKTKKAVVNVNESEISEIINLDSMKNQLSKILDQMKDDFTKQLSVRGAGG